MWKKKRHQIVVNIIRPFFLRYFKKKYNVTFGPMHSFPEGSLIVCNHLTVMDEFLIGALFKEQLYYMASIDLFEHAITGKLIKFLVNPIPKEKSKKSDMMAIRNCLTVAKENGNICIFVEGNRSYSGELGYVEPSIGKLAKLLKKPLVICNILGGYGTDPRWGMKIRRGKMDVFIKKIIPYDDIKQMEPENIYKLIVNEINVDNYSYHNKYVGKTRAEYLEKVVFICPHCHHLHTLSSKGNIIKCSNCGLEVTYNEDLSLSASIKDFPFIYVKDWYNYQIDYMKQMEIKNNEVIFEDDIKLFVPRLYKSKKKIGTGKIKLYSDRFVFSLKKNELTFNFDDIEAITAVGKKKMNIYINSTTYQFFNNQRTNVLKYMFMFYIIKSRKENSNYVFLGL